MDLSGIKDMAEKAEGMLEKAEELKDVVGKVGGDDSKLEGVIDSAKEAVEGILKK